MTIRLADNDSGPRICHEGSFPYAAPNALGGYRIKYRIVSTIDIDAETSEPYWLNCIEISDHKDAMGFEIWRKIDFDDLKFPNLFHALLAEIASFHLPEPKTEGA